MRSADACGKWTTPSFTLRIRAAAELPVGCLLSAAEQPLHLLVVTGGVPEREPARLHRAKRLRSGVDAVTNVKEGQLLPEHALSRRHRAICGLLWGTLLATAA